MPPPPAAPPSFFPAPAPLVAPPVTSTRAIDPAGVLPCGSTTPPPPPPPPPLSMSPAAVVSGTASELPSPPPPTAPGPWRRHTAASTAARFLRSSVLLRPSIPNLHSGTAAHPGRRAVLQVKTLISSTVSSWLGRASVSTMQDEVRSQKLTPARWRACVAFCSSLSCRWAPQPVRTSRGC